MDRVRLLERRDIDELILLDIAATPEGRGPRFDEIEQLCDQLFCPVTVGGGIRNINDIRRLLQCGADKVSINTAAIANPEFIDEVAQKFGSQAITVSVDAEGSDVLSFAGHERRGNRILPLVEWVAEAERRGAGEILLTSVEHEGMMDGYDLDLIREVSDAVSIPVIANGGCGSYEHMRQAIEAGAHAVAVGAAFQFKEMTPKGAARYLREQGIAVRL
jgi:cyclase